MDISERKYKPLTVAEKELLSMLKDVAADLYSACTSLINMNTFDTYPIVGGDINAGFEHAEKPDSDYRRAQLEEYQNKIDIVFRFAYSTGMLDDTRRGSAYCANLTELVGGLRHQDDKYLNSLKTSVKLFG